MTPQTVAHQVPLSMGFSRQEYTSGLPFPPPSDLPNPGIEPGLHALQADSLPTEPQGKPNQNVNVFKTEQSKMNSQSAPLEFRRGISCPASEHGVTDALGVWRAEAGSPPPQGTKESP